MDVRILQAKESLCPSSIWVRCNTNIPIATLVALFFMIAGCSSSSTEQAADASQQSVEKLVWESQADSRVVIDESRIETHLIENKTSDTSIVSNQTRDASGSASSGASFSNPNSGASSGIGTGMDSPSSTRPSAYGPPFVGPEPMAMELPSASRAPAVQRAEPAAAAAFQPQTPELTSSSSAATTHQPSEFDQGSHLDHLPAGSSHAGADGFATVEVYYATDRARHHLPLSAYHVEGNKVAFMGLSGCSVLLIGMGGLGLLMGPSKLRYGALLTGCVTGCLAIVIMSTGQASIEKHGVAYSSDRGTLARGVCEVTVPDNHQRGLVERPSLLRLEFSEDRRKHVVLTSAIELSESDFDQRMSETVAGSENQDLLVFIHGYNVDFESAVQRTAQIAVDLPFTGVPVCYSWPSQATLMGYSVDENNAIWTVSHLKRFLSELVEKSGARSINVVAHSMGNRAMTAAIQQLDLQERSELDHYFDRIVLAAPDVDADHFKRDLAPALARMANHVTLYASSDDQALIASKKVHGYPRAGESGQNIVIAPGIETIDVSGVDLSLLGHSYYGDNESMLRDLYEVVGARLPATNRMQLIPRGEEPFAYWQLANRRNGQPDGRR